MSFISSFIQHSLQAAKHIDNNDFSQNAFQAPDARGDSKGSLGHDELLTSALQESFAPFDDENNQVEILSNDKDISDESENLLNKKIKNFIPDDPSIDVSQQEDSKETPQEAFNTPFLSTEASTSSSPNTSANISSEGNEEQKNIDNNKQENIVQAIDSDFLNKSDLVDTPQKNITAHQLTIQEQAYKQELNRKLINNDSLENNHYQAVENKKLNNESMTAKEIMNKETDIKAEKINREPIASRESFFISESRKSPLAFIPEQVTKQEMPQVRIGQINVLIDEQAVMSTPKQTRPSVKKIANPFGLRGI
ncbi:hypothetical protein [sulfur-oxidizing endosymbiont of Gigantopelta aegis]|uniref:hypothetical protein n=1 Tax=sulfur-oxidizing endosymbiont of Gigantopelta aegis TaxID=2794934 RepID=UPI0018DD53C4|nr:hypothetical protein [sulfur-oxidizing endosymbiont of Gigantopelta aegis]